MNLYASILPPLVQVVFLVIIGVLCRVRGILSHEGTGELSKFIIMVTLPIILFISGTQSDVAELARVGPIVFLAGIVCPIIGFGVGALVAWLFRLPPGQANVIRVGASLSNTAFVGIPICAALWGTQGAMLAALYDEGLNFPLLLLAPLAYGQSANKNPLKELLLAPMVWGLILGILWKISGIGLPPLVATPLTVLGNVTLPLSLVMIGALAVPDQIVKVTWRPLIAFLFSRLLFVPVTIWGIALVLGLRDTGAAVIVLQTAMPASVMATVMAREYGSEANLAASGAMFSVLLSLATIPLIAALVLGR
jgi:malate permease and related proteins